MKKKLYIDVSTALWQEFINKHNLNEKQTNDFIKYYNMLIEFNDIHNITAITDLNMVLNDHFSDSLILNSFIDCHSISFIADIGAGAGFPSIPLKIKYPDLKVVLIEVVQKKIYFLESVIQNLNLENIEIYDKDWRTFLRKSEYPIEVFCARASLQPEELIRMFKPSCYYKNSKLIYWASQHWDADKKIIQFIKNEYSYIVGEKKRRLILLEKE